MKILKILLLIASIVAFTTASFALDTQLPDQCIQIFSDVDSNNAFCKYIWKFAELGITSGYDDGTYRPADTLSRAQMAVFILRALELYTVPGQNWSLSLDKMFLPPGQTYTYYTQTVTMTGSAVTTPSYSCSAEGLQGITASANGNICTISGTTTAAGLVLVKFTMVDSAAPSHIDQRVRTIAFNSPTPLSLSTYPQSLGAGVQGSAYYKQVTMTGSGGTAPYTYTCWGSGVTGITASPSGNVCTISGTPAGTGTYTVTFQVTDSATPSHAVVQTPMYFSVTVQGEPTHESLVYNDLYANYIIAANGTMFFDATLSSPCTTYSKDLRFTLTTADAVNIDMLVKKSYDMSLPWPTLSDYDTRLAQYGDDSGSFTDGIFFWNFNSGTGEVVVVEQTYTQYPGFSQDDTYYILVHNPNSLQKQYYIRYYCY